MKTLLSWSTGKDSAWTLHILRQDPSIRLCGLFTTVNEAFDRVAMHAVRHELLQAQASAAQLPLHIIRIPHPCPNKTYERIMGDFVQKAIAEGIEAMAFGDLFLEDIRTYRESNLAGTGITPLFPIWGLPTNELAHDMINAGLGARITCIDPNQLDASFAGREFNHAFLDDLPSHVDPCGENGEFHSYVFKGPMFFEEISIRTGEVTFKDGFFFTDIIPKIRLE